MADRPRTDPDTVLINGWILIMDPEGPVVEAVRLRGERIAAVGAAPDVLAGADARAEVVDL